MAVLHPETLREFRFQLLRFPMPLSRLVKAVTEQDTCFQHIPDFLSFLIAEDFKTRHSRSLPFSVFPISAYPPSLDFTLTF
jgi:hypothetical protein